LDRDVRLGAGMVAAFCIVVVATTPALSLSPGTRRTVLLVVAAMAVADFGVLALRWDRYARQRLLVFPALVLVGEVTLALCTRGVSPEYTGFFTLGFVYIGLTQPRGTGVAFSLPAGACWIVSQQHWAPGLGIRLGLSIVVWLLLSGALAVRTSRDNNSSKRLVAHAYTDVLTGLGNRRAISDRLELLIEKAASSASSLLLIDLDGFKKVNDTFGHVAGDELLVVASKRIQTNLREGDLAGRLGGDEFAIVLDDGGLDKAREVAARMIASLATPIALSRMRLSVTASIGIVEIVSATTVEQVLSHADLAMYQAKAAGRNQVSIYESALHTRMMQRLEVETELRDAVDRDEFEAHYQPIVHMGTGAIIAVEALARWRHPRRGLLAPAEFLVACQELGLMQTLGERLLQTACRQASFWQPIDPARAVSLAFNLSADEAFAPGLVGRIERTLEATGFPADLLILEITEHIVMADKMRAREAMQELQSLGVRIAIDDFGTGYSSLAYLREFPVNILKIDRSFVTPLGVDDRALALFRSILAIAEALSLDVVVEGVETREQAQILVELGCLVAQGFYFDRPRHPDEFGRSADLWPRSLQV
jgi:diguanylate cyclase (GGDEF)-like protein